MSRLLLLTGLFWLAVTIPVAAEEKWESLFNGKDLTGWTAKIRGSAVNEDPMQTFRVQDNCITVSYEKYDTFQERFGHLFYKTRYSDYTLRLEYRFFGEQCKGGPGWALRNSGVMIHGQDPATMTKDQSFPVSAEVQLLGGDGKTPRTTANLCTPGTNVIMNGKLITQHCNNSSSKTFHGEQWVKCEIEVNGSGKVVHKINDEIVLTYEQIQFDPRDKDALNIMPKMWLKDQPPLISEGTISLQSESHPVQFRKIEIWNRKK